MWYNGAGGDFLTHLLVVDDEVSILELIKNSLGIILGERKKSRIGIFSEIKTEIS